MSTYNSYDSQLNNDGLTTGLFFIGGSILGGLLLYLTRSNECPIPDVKISPTLEPSSSLVILGESTPSIENENEIVEISDNPVETEEIAAIETEMENDQIETVDNPTS